MNTKVISVGIDVSKDSWSVSVFHNGSEVTAFNYLTCKDLETDVWGLVFKLNELFPDYIIKTAHEHGHQAYAIHDAFLQAAVKNIIVSGGSVSKTEKERHYKSDKSDARAIARALDANQLQEVFLNKNQRDLRLLVNQYDKLSKQQATEKVRFKRVSIENGTNIQSFSTKTATAAINHFEGDTNVAETLESILRNYQVFRAEMRRIMLLIQESLFQTNYHPLFQQLKSISGISITLASQLIAAYGDAGRFPTFNQFKSFSGLTPGQHQSGGHNLVFQKKTKSNRLRTTYHNAAMSLIKYNPHYRTLFNHYRSSNPKNALIKVQQAFAKEIYPLWEC